MCNEEEKDMAVVESDIRLKLAEIKKRANKRKEVFNKKPSDRYIKELDDNAQLLYDDQVRTME